MSRKLIYILSLLVAVLATTLPSCIEDGFTNLSSDQPTFSVDTLKMGELFTGQPGTTHKFVIYNRHKKGLNISDMQLTGPNAEMFRLNVDGMSGTRFSNVEIRPNDSIYVFVEATIAPTGKDIPVEICTQLDITTNGVTKPIILSAMGQDVEVLRAQVISSDLTLDSKKPYQIFDSLVVAPGATLTLAPGTKLCFHDAASLRVRGTLIANGTLQQPISLAGDRTGNVITDVTFDLMSRQWDGVYIYPTSRGNKLSYTCIRNTCDGLVMVGDDDATQGNRPSLTMVNTQLRNSGGLVLDVYNADVNASGCEFAEAAFGVVRLNGGTHHIEQCTFANYYLFAAIAGPALYLDGIGTESDSEYACPLPMQASIVNSIIYGLAADIYPGDLTGSQVFIKNCLLKSAGSDDDNFINCIWDADPLYYTVREDYLFDYRLKNESPCIGAGDPALNTPAAQHDAYGLARLRDGKTDIGAYVFTQKD